MNDRTIFCLGARSHYENPTSDILKFFLDPSEEHSLGSLFIRALSTRAQLDQSYENKITITREKQAHENKRIDLLIESSESILIVENKHWSGLEHNPLPIYEKYGAELALDSNKKIEYLVLLFDEADTTLKVAHPLWKFLKYEDFIDEILKLLNVSKAREQQTCRWKILTDEFVSHLQLESITPAPEMISAWLELLRTSPQNVEPKRLNKATERIVQYVSSYINRNLSAKQVTVDQWRDVGRGNGWSGGSALAFSVLENKSCHIFVSLAIQTAESNPVDGIQLRLIVWMRSPLRSDDLREQIENKHNFAYLDDTSQIKYWEDGIAFEKKTYGTDLGLAMDDLIRVAIWIKGIPVAEPVSAVGLYAPVDLRSLPFSS